jgi:hypothetical protein
MRGVLIAPLLIAATLAARTAGAPLPRRPRGYAFASVAFAHHPDNGPLYHRVSPPLGGASWDLSGGGGLFVTHVAALEGEFMFGGKLSTPQRFSYFTSDEYIEESRDLILDALVRGYPGNSRRLSLVGGGGYAWTRTAETSVIHTDSFFRNSPGQPTSAWSHGMTVTAGIDVVLLERRHAAVASSARLRWINRSSRDYGGNGLGLLTFQFGASVFLR